MSINISLEHPSGRVLQITGVSSILAPRDSTVMFVGKKCADRLDSLLEVKDCLVFVLSNASITSNIEERHILRIVDNPRQAFGKFLEDNHAEERLLTEYKSINGAIISKDAQIGQKVKIAPGTFIDRDVVIGNNCTIHSGVRLLPGTKIADQCDIQENTVIGSIAMAYEGRQRIPQVGGIYIDNHVSIGANCIIDRGAIDDTYIGENVAIGSICAIGHNVTLAPCCMVIAGTVLFGSVSIGESAYISGNVVIKNGITIGANAYVGMGSVVTQNVPAGKTVFGNPARILRSPE